MDGEMADLILMMDTGKWCPDIGQDYSNEDYAYDKTGAQQLNF